MTGPITIDPFLFGLLLLFSFFSGAWYYERKASVEATKGHLCSFCLQPVGDRDRWREDG